MKHRTRWMVLCVALLTIASLALPTAGLAEHENRVFFGPIEDLGHSPFASGPGPFDNINSDLAFWGNTAYQGNFNGFRIVDISDPANPGPGVRYDQCNGGQGDVMIWEDLLIRTWDSPAGATAVCGTDDTGTPIPVPLGFEGLHFFDVSDTANIELVHSVNLSNARMQADFGRPGCGSHTATLVPDEDTGNVYIYNGASSGTCGGTEIIEVLPDNVTESDFLRFENFGRSCHDIAVFLGEVKRGVCAGGNGFTSFRMDPNRQGNGSITNPHTMHNSGAIPDVTVGHTATFTWDGSRFVFGHEPGGGTAAQCEEQDPDRNRMFFMHDTESGDKIGEWFMHRAQGADENCTLHNINFIPTTDGSDLLVSGNYQAGTWVTDWTDPENPTDLAFADPPSLTPGTLTLGGAWSTYWYNGFLYETEITRGLNVFGLNDPRADMVEFDFLNPQTQMQSIGQDVVGTSTISIGHRNRNPHRFQGNVSSSEDACVAQREVVIVKVRNNGTRQQVAEATTNNNGRYRKKHTTGGAGRYFARARRVQVVDGINTTDCLKAQSRTKRFNK